MARQYNEFVGKSLQNPHTAAMNRDELASDAVVEPVNLVAEDGAPSFGLLYRRGGKTAKVGVHIMHPRTNHTQHYSVIPFVNAGYTVLGRNSRWPNNDSDMLHEAVLLDLAAGVRRLRELGCERVILLGSSGGSSLSAMYQGQARAPIGERFTETPAGDPFDLNAFDLPPADGVLFLGGHAGQGVVLSRSLDASVVDEANPMLIDADLDMFDPRNGFATPPESSCYDPAFLDRFRAAQAQRLDRLDRRAFELISMKRDLAKVATETSSSRFERLAKLGWFMVIYRTTADPAFVDLSIDPDDRRVFSYSSGRPDLENFGEVGLGRIITPRAWLSTWSGNYSRANTVANVAKFDDPFLIVHYAGDAGTRMQDSKDFLSASTSSDKELFIARNVDHYGFQYLPDGKLGVRNSEGISRAIDWALERFPI